MVIIREEEVEGAVEPPSRIPTLEHWWEEI